MSRTHRALSLSQLLDGLPARDHAAEPRRRRVRRTSVRIASVLVAAIVAVLGAGCGQAGIGQHQPVTRDPSSAASSLASSAQPVELHRKGGIAGFDDRLTIASDGTVTLSARDGSTRRCRLSPDLLARTRAIGWATLPPTAEPTGRSDVMRYVVRAGGRTTVLDADAPPPGQAAAVDTAAALFAAAADCPPAE